MTSSPQQDPERLLRPGQQPYDALNGIRIGAIAGALVGIIALALIGMGGPVAVILLSVAGGVIGYAWERGDRRRG